MTDAGANENRSSDTKRPYSYGLRLRLMALVLAAVTPFVILIGMVARQHRFNERSAAQEKALSQALALSRRVDGRIGSIETVLLTLVHSVSPRPADSLRNDKLLRNVAAELPNEFAHFAVTTPRGLPIGTSDTLATGVRRPIVLSSSAKDTLLDFVIQGPAPLYGKEGPPAIAISYEDTALGVGVAGFVTVQQLQRELSRRAVPADAIGTIVDKYGAVIFRSRNPDKWVGRNISDSPLFITGAGKQSGIAAVQDLDAGQVFSGFAATQHVPWIVNVGSEQYLAFAKERADFWRAIWVGTLALLLAIVLAWTQATRIIVPIRTVARDAVLFAKGDLSHRSSAGPAGDEIGILSETLNTMAEALEKREDALRRSEMRFRAIIENVEDVIVILNPDGSRSYVSPAMTRLLGYSNEELLAGGPQDIVHPDDWPAVRELIANARRFPGAVASGQARCMHKDGSWRIFLGALCNLNDVPGVEGILVNLRDVTEQSALESELRQAQKMELVGQLAGGVAHDFNNLLTVITGRTEFLLEAENLGEEQETDLSEIRKAAARATELTRQLLAFSRKQLLQPRVLDLNRMLAEVEPMLRRLIGEDIQIRIIAGSKLGSITADPGQLQQILLNLALNARDAMPSGGVITLQTANQTIRDSAGPNSTQVAPGEYVVLQVADTGMGMDATTQSRIFEPFFTTKGQGKGTGLGLSTVYGIVKQSGASISVISAPGEGTRFTVYFPRSDEYALAQSAEKDADTPLSGTETILLVEDDRGVRNLVERVLNSRGYRVLSAEHGVDALQLSSALNGTIDLILTDIVMPTMSGREMVDALRLKRPGVRVIYMSGYTDDEIVRRGLHDPTMAFIQKPFTAEHLAMLVRKILDNGA
jgi:PAS domain S-box-containing protein